MRCGSLLCLLVTLVVSARVAAGPTCEAAVIGSGVRVRAGPGTKWPVVATLDQDRTIRVIGRAVGWYRTEHGWVAEDYLRLLLEGNIAADGQVGQALSLAQSLLGREYAYGRCGPDRFDCSGLICYIFRRLGLDPPREAGRQMAMGSEVARSDLRPGDLVFFTTDGGGGVSHVGLYLFAGEFIHASSGRGRVTTSTMDQGYYARRYVGAVRIIAAAPG